MVRNLWKNLALRLIDDESIKHCLEELDKLNEARQLVAHHAWIKKKKK